MRAVTPGMLRACHAGPGCRSVSAGSVGRCPAAASASGMGTAGQDPAWHAALTSRPGARGCGACGGVVSGGGDSGPMKNFKVTWTGRDGKPRVSAVGYDKATAEERKTRLVAEKYDDVEVVEAKP